MAAKNFFKSQREILEYLGKNPNDRNLIGRMISKGRIERLDDGYELLPTTNPTEIERLRAENEEMRKRIKKQQGEIEMLKEVFSNEQQNDNDEAKIQWEYREEKANRYQKAMNLVIRTTYNVIKPKLGNRLEDYDEFRDSILNSVKEQLGDDE